jgi:UDP-2-acetamido-2,6-beta-L-arabino-hexul-4-ose reductase
MTTTTRWDAPFNIERLQVHRDPRGALYEALRFTSQKIPAGGQIYVYTVAPGARRGDHYHERKSEWFVCVAGSVRLLLITPDGAAVDEILDAEAPRMVHAAPGTAHAVVNESDAPAVIVAYASKEFDLKDADTVPMSAGAETANRR